MNFKKINLSRVIVLLSLLMTDISFAERGYGLDEFDDLELESLDSLKKIPAKKIDKGQGLNLFDDGLYLIDDNFDFGEDELELQKLELNPNEMKTAKEYEDSLDVFFKDSTQVRTNTSSNPNHPIQKQPKRSTPPTTTFRSRTGALKFRSTPHDPTFSSVGENGFGVSTIAGPIMPITMKGVHIGYNYGIQIDTPISFKFGDLEGNVGTELIFSSMASFDFAESVKLTSIIGNFSLFPSQSLEIKVGLGFTPETIQTDSTKYLTFSAISIPIDINYYLPLDFSGQSNFTKLKVALNLHLQRTLADGVSDNWFGSNDRSLGYVHAGVLIQFYQSFFH